MVAKANKAAKSKAKATDNDDEAPAGDASYDALLKGTWGSIGKEKNIPEGTYRLEVRNVFAKKASVSQAGKPISAQLVVFLKPLEPILDTDGGDVDSEAFAELGDDYDLSINQVTSTFWVGELRDWQAVFDFAAKLGIEYEEVAELSREEVYKLMRGRTVNGYVKSREYNGKTSFEASAFSAEE